MEVPTIVGHGSSARWWSLPPKGQTSKIGTIPCAKVTMARQMRPPTSHRAKPRCRTNGKRIDVFRSCHAEWFVAACNALKLQGAAVSAAPHQATHYVQRFDRRTRCRDSNKSGSDFHQAWPSVKNPAAPSTSRQD